MNRYSNSKPYLWQVYLPDDSREFYLWDIRDMLHRLYPDRKEWMRQYAKIYKYDLPRLIKYHEQLLFKLAGVKTENEK